VNAYAEFQQSRNLATATVCTFPLPIHDIMTTTSIDFSNKGLGVADAVVIAALLPLNVSQFYQWCTVYTV
jgi:hypothetical protein